MGLGTLTKVNDGCAFPREPGHWCSILLAAEVQLDGTALEMCPRRAGADPWAFRGRGEMMELFPERGGEGEAETGVPKCSSLDTVGAGGTNCSSVH